MAEAFLKARLKKDGVKGIKADSCGLQTSGGAPVSPPAPKALATFGIKNFKHKSKPLTRELYDKADLLVCMTEGHKRLVAAMSDYTAAGNHAANPDVPVVNIVGKITTVAAITGGRDVDDPWGGPDEAYLKTAQYLEYACADIVKYILEKMPAKSKSRRAGKK